ncbi:MAG TPA: prenyltransferase [Actinomycetota bacterium]|nr:prenyltransferase [Actinomycetota bacterium]
MTVSQEVLGKLEEGYEHAVVSWVEDDGYPTSVATGFRWSRSRGVVVLDTTAEPFPTDRDVNVIFSHIRPQPGVGYDERRYVSLTGRLRPADGRYEVVGSRGYAWDEQDLHFVRYSERGVPRAQEYLGELSADRGEPVRPRLSFGWLALRATRLPFVTATAVPVFLGVAVAAHNGRFDLGLALWTLIGAVLIHLGLNVANDVFDTMSGADAANDSPTQFSGGSRVVHYGLVKLRTLAVLSSAFYLSGIGIGLYLAAQRGFWPLFWLGAVGVAISVAYTAPPLRLVHRALGEIAVGAGFGPIVVLGAYFVQAQRYSAEALYASVPIGLLVALILYVNEVPDRAGDAAVGKRTLPVRLAPSTVTTGYAIAAAVIYGWVLVGVAAGLMPVPTLAALVTIPMAMKVFRGLRDHYDSPYELMPYMGTGVNLQLAAGMLLVAGYVAQILLDRFG